MKVGFIGSGRMAGALMERFIAANLAKPAAIYASDINAGRLKELKRRLKVNIVPSNRGIMKSCEVVFLAVKPQDMNVVLGEIKGEASKKHLIISIAAGISLGTLEEALPKARIVRVMPNAACIAGEGMSAFCLGRNSADKERETVKKLMSSCGKCIEVREGLMDVITALSGSGPAFFALLLKYFAEAGNANGLGKEEALLVARQTLYGTAKLLALDDMPPDRLIEMVASKGGTTEAGLKVLQDSDAGDIIMKAIEAALKRSKELG